MWWFILVCFGTAFVVSLSTTALILRIARRAGFVDQPEEKRKVHKQPTPLGGGIGVWLGVVLPLALAQAVAWLIGRGIVSPDRLPSELAPHWSGVLYRSSLLWSVLAGGTILAVIGLLDDIRNLSWQLRLLIQMLVAGAVVLGAGVQATAFLPWPWVGKALSILWILVLINSFNFLDNMDALSGGVAMIVSLMFAVIMLATSTAPHWFVAGVLLILGGSLAGFLCFNWPPAKIFMGDAGSYFVGYLLACCTLLGTFWECQSTGGKSQYVILAPLCVLAVPLYDFVSVILIRLREGRSPFHPDKSHFSHRLVEMGFSSRDAVLTIHLATATTSLAGLLLYRVDDWTSAGLLVLLVLCVLWIVAILETVGRRENSPNSQ